ncbi:hypothetical protein Tco_0448145 [Tanacetum coccineum]
MVPQDTRPTQEVDTYDELLSEHDGDSTDPTLEGSTREWTELDYYNRQRLRRSKLYGSIAWTSSEERSAAIEVHVRTLEAQVATLITRTSSLQTRLTTALGRIATLVAKDPSP